MTSATTTTVMEALGLPVPALDHAVSVSLPTWRDNVGYEEGEKRVLDAMCTGYPRFFIHKSIQKLAGICETRFGQSGESCILFPSSHCSDECRTFMMRRESALQSSSLVRTVQFLIHPELREASQSDCLEGDCIGIHIVFFPSDFFPVAKQFWQHTGLGISSRYAERCLSMLESQKKTESPTPTRTVPTSPILGKAGNRHYARKSSITSPCPPVRSVTNRDSSIQEDDLTESHATYMEERYGRNLPQSQGEVAKRTLRRRIAGVLVCDPADSLRAPCKANAEETGTSSRGVQNLTEEDVYLLPTGMTAIWYAYQLVLDIMPKDANSVCFGFPYTDTLKILQKWGPGCHHFGNGTAADLDAYEALLLSSPPNSISSLFAEFPSNPLLRSPDLKRIRNLADEHDFLIVVDDTIGNFVNVDVLSLADIVVTGLTKIFSGDANVMGGSLILSPGKRHYAALRSTLLSRYEDTYFLEDAIFLERNSRDFARRTHQIDINTRMVAEFLYEHSQPNKPDSVLKKVWYPLFESRSFYEQCRIPASSRRNEGGYGGLLSLTFSTAAASSAFFDTLTCAKGPSLGTNFTLACPYTILAHYTELEWAGKWGVEKELVRISIGLEDGEQLVLMMKRSLEAAHATTD